MEIEIFQVLELGARCRKQLLSDPNMVVHRTAYIHEQQHLDLIAPLGHEFEVQVAGIAGGCPDGVVEIKFELVALAHELAQALERDLDIAGAQFDLIVVIAELTLIPDLYRAAMAGTPLADANALRVVAVSAERGTPRCADVSIAPLMALLLVFQTLAQGLHQLFPTAQRLDQRLLLGRKIELVAPRQPLGWNPSVRHRLSELFHTVLGTLEVGAEYLIEAVVVTFILHQTGTRQEVEVVQTGHHYALVERGQKTEKFRDRDRNPALAQCKEEIDQHDGLLPNRRCAQRLPWRRAMNASRSNRWISCSFLSNAP